MCFESSCKTKPQGVSSVAPVSKQSHLAKKNSEDIFYKTRQQYACVTTLQGGFLDGHLIKWLAYGLEFVQRAQQVKLINGVPYILAFYFVRTALSQCHPDLSTV